MIAPAIDRLDERMVRARVAQATWARCSLAHRVNLLRSLRVVLAKHIDELVDTIANEVGKTPMDTLAGDVMVTLEQLRFYERNAQNILRPRRRGKPAFFYRGARFQETLEPFGVVLIFAPWNYPLQLALIPAATALFAGNAVILKCSDRTPRTATMMATIYREAGLPADLLQISFESPHQAAALLDAMPDLIFFTGGSRNGRAIAAKAAEQLIPTILELGGKDPALVFASCDLERTVNGLTYGSFANRGKVCVGTKRIYVEQMIYPAFLRRFSERAAQLRSGSTQDSDIPPATTSDFDEPLLRNIHDAIARGAVVQTAWNPGAPLNAPLILTNVPADSALLHEESFAPVVCVSTFETEQEAVTLANASVFALSASIWTGDPRQGARVAARLGCGSCAINDVIRNIGNPETAFGGNSQSGYGRYRGAAGIKAFSRVKATMTAGHLQRQEIHWFPSSSKTYGRLRALLLARHSDTLLTRIKALWKVR